ncbi:hypothetical protein V2A60_007162 [Cordyceps javanica]|uniref:Ankyrin repeats (3 copies) domain-containing protein n=1 Tax=Cordyceps javanica TaxID=43265 RepID=A0A545VRE7_9HYPO|nr:ankyrin repeats (3 copies) domain-containing protein [Cordyceps javanica]TQW04288.1 ankyrin repeats (3 copies) domain-containing protein [Cordyceps javanica]
MAADNDSLIHAASAGDLDRLRTLLAADKEPTQDTIHALRTAAVKGLQLDIMDYLLSQYPGVPLDEEVVRAAINTGSVPILQALLARDPSCANMQFDRRGTPLVVACMGQQSIAYLQCLLEAGADPNQDPDAAAYPLALVAALYRDTAAIDLLLQHGARLENSGALAAAAQRGNEPMLCHLMARGARSDSDAATATTTPPLHVAVGAGHAGAARILLQHGADANVRNSAGNRAMDVALAMQSKGKDTSEVLKVLEES